MMNDVATKEPITAAEAEYRLLYSVVVAGKSAKFAFAAMARFLGVADCSPYAWVKKLDGRGELDSALRAARTGSYGRIARSFREIATEAPDLMKAQPADLEKFHGVGPKSARFAIVWVRPQERFAALDTHVLKWLRFIGHTAPRSTPSGEKYASLERVFIAEADKRGFNPRLLDAMIWEHAANWSGRSDPAVWPAWLQKEPALPPPDVLAYFKSYAA